jgi:hypothetical protein
MQNVVLKKMRVTNNQPVDYYLDFDDNGLLLNEMLGKKIKLTFLNQINCLGCGAKTKKSFAQGFCYKCFISHPETSPCILRPELCEAHKGISRNMEWSNNHCLTNHIVYLAVSSEVKVGVTRESQTYNSTRWIDQGANSIIRLASTPNRYLAGCIEVKLKNWYTDKTNWQKMLKNDLLVNVDLIAEKQNAWEKLPTELQQYFIDNDEIINLKYPVIQYPDKVKSISFDQQSVIEGVLTAIKGQYLILDNQFALNIRKHGGYNINVEIEK